jgi:hypothetical protein
MDASVTSKARDSCQDSPEHNDVQLLWAKSFRKGQLLQVDAELLPDGVS